MLKVLFGKHDQWRNMFAGKVNLLRTSGIGVVHAGDFQAWFCQHDEKAPVWLHGILEQRFRSGHFTVPVEPKCKRLFSSSRNFLSTNILERTQVAWLPDRANRSCVGNNSRLFTVPSFVNVTLLPLVCCVRKSHHPGP
jgi:hypothetical protein